MRGRQADACSQHQAGAEREEGDQPGGAAPQVLHRLSEDRPDHDPDGEADRRPHHDPERQHEQRRHADEEVRGRAQGLRDQLLAPARGRPEPVVLGRGRLRGADQPSLLTRDAALVSRTGTAVTGAARRPHPAAGSPRG